MPLGDLNPGPEDRCRPFLTAADGAVFMSADDGDHGRELWRTDGTAAGTAQTARDQPRAARRESGGAERVTLRPAVRRRRRESAAWSRGATEELATRQLANLGPDDIVNSSFPSGLTRPRRRRALLRRRRHQRSRAVGQRRRRGARSWCPTSIRTAMAFSVFTDFERLGDAVFFAADDGEHGNELWRSDGTEAGTTLWKDIAVGGASGSPHQLTPSATCSSSPPTRGCSATSSGARTRAAARRRFATSTPIAAPIPSG